MTEEQCGDLLVSTGPSNEYLLDICIQTGAVCLGDAEAQHIGCCCSTIPLGRALFLNLAQQHQSTNRCSHVINDTDRVCLNLLLLTWTWQHFEQRRHFWHHWRDWCESASQLQPTASDYQRPSGRVCRGGVRDNYRKWEHMVHSCQWQMNSKDVVLQYYSSCLLDYW